MNNNSNNSTVSGRIVATKRHGHTVYGNPMMSVSLDTLGFGEWIRISNDSSLVYEIDNQELKEISHTYKLTRAGRISSRVR